MRIKRKGAYGYERPSENAGTLERLWHKNHSSLIIPKAAEAALVHGQCIRDFITNHNDIFDFMLRTKVGKSDKLMLNGTTELQRITRYYIGNQGGSLTKISPPTKGYEVGQWKRATKLSDDFYNSVMEANQSQEWIEGFDGELDTLGLPWDERINTKNRSKYVTRITEFNVGYLAAPCNNIRDFNRLNINFEYYIAETEKLVNPLRD